MGDAKRIVLSPVTRRQADALIERVHYSRKTVPNSQLNLGVYLDGSLLGAMQFGPPMDRRKAVGLVAGTRPSGVIELNRMAFDDRLPRNSESRALGIASRLIRKHAPAVEWILSFADATQCGDGTIYRAAGYVLTGIKVNKQILRAPDGRTIARKSLDNTQMSDGRFLSAAATDLGFEPIEGFQLRYVRFLTPDGPSRLNVPIVPFDEIETVGARMYRGQRVGSIDVDAPAQPDGNEGGSIPTPTLQTDR